MFQEPRTETSARSRCRSYQAAILWGHYSSGLCKPVSNRKNRVLKIRLSGSFCDTIVVREIHRASSTTKSRTGVDSNSSSNSWLKRKPLLWAPLLIYTCGACIATLAFHYTKLKPRKSSPEISAGKQEKKKQLEQQRRLRKTNAVIPALWSTPSRHGQATRLVPEQSLSGLNNSFVFCFQRSGLYELKCFCVYWKSTYRDLSEVTGSKMPDGSSVKALELRSLQSSNEWKTTQRGWI